MGLHGRLLRLELCQYGKGGFGRPRFILWRLESNARRARVGIEREIQLFEQRSRQVDMRRGEDFEIAVIGIGDCDGRGRGTAARGPCKHTVLALERALKM